MTNLEEGQEIVVFHPVYWPEPFRATVMQFEGDEHVLVCTIEPVIGSEGDELFDEGEYLVVEIAHIVEENS